MNTPEDLFCELRCVRSLAELHHTMIRGEGSHAAHIALQEFYEGITDLTDELIESYQGKYGIIKYALKPVSVNMEFLGKLKPFVTLLEESTPFGERTKNSYLYNQIDEIVTLTYKTIYKLTNLK